MEKSILISVIVPAYNAEKYISQCFDSLLSQTHKNIEIIVVDNGSTDNTEQIVKKYSSVKYIRLQKNDVSAARNTGFNAATGKYIHFMDADDLVPLDFYEKMAQAAQETDAEMACCGFIFERYPEQSQHISHKLLLSCTEDKILMTNVCNYGACWKYLYKRTFLKEKHLYFEEGRIAAEDRIFSLQTVFFANKIVLVPDTVYIYKNRKNAITTTRNVEFIRKRRADRKYAEQFQKDFAQRHNFSLDKTLNARHWQYKVLGVPLFGKHSYGTGKTRWYFLGIPIFQKKEIGK